MKLLTLNTHSLAEDHYESKLKAFVEAVAEELPDVIALQEVNQRQDTAEIPFDCLEGYHSCDTEAVIREGNHAQRVEKGLSALGVNYEWSWLPIKTAYGQFDEGVAIMSRFPITETNVLTASRTEDPANWKTRKLLGARIGHTWFYSVHLGWWDDPEEPFAAQWQRVTDGLPDQGTVFLMGDFNSPSERRQEGYDLVLSHGWLDTYTLAQDKDRGVTVHDRIAGWTHRELPSCGSRMDHIFCNRRLSVRSSHVVFNDIHGPVVSDHFGVMVIIDNG